MPSPVNNAPFNTPSELFNGTGSNPPPTRIARQIYVPTPGVPSKARPARTRTTFGATPDDFKNTVVVTESSPVQTRSLAGYYSCVQASKVAHQHRVRFWAEDSVVGALAKSPAADPTSSELDQKYEDLRQFSYMPESFLPTRSEFDDLARPQRRPAVVAAAVSRMGIVDPGVEVLSAADAGTSVEVSAPAPFAEKLQQACPGAQTFVRSSGALTFTAEQLEV